MHGQGARKREARTATCVDGAAAFVGHGHAVTRGAASRGKGKARHGVVGAAADALRCVQRGQVRRGVGTSEASGSTCTRAHTDARTNRLVVKDAVVLGALAGAVGAVGIAAAGDGLVDAVACARLPARVRRR